MWWPGIALAATLRVALAMGLLLFLFPHLLLPVRPGRDLADRMAAACTTGLLVVVAGGHLLASLKLFESFGFFFLLTSVTVGLLWYRTGAKGVHSTLEGPLVTGLSLLDRLVEEGWKVLRREGRLGVPPALGAGANWPDTGRMSPAARRTLWVLAWATLAVALYTRLTDALTYAGPASSDYVVHLQWVNWLLDPTKGLFPSFDWVYPKGMNATVGFLHLISRESTHIALRTAGPLFSLLTLAGIWYVVRAATRSEAGALLAGALFAGAPAWLPAVWERQSAPLPQEFAMALLLPGAWWAFRYVKEGDPLDRFLAGASAVVVAASHWGVLAYLGVAMGAALVPADVALPVRIRRVVLLVLWAGGGALLGLAPQLAALAAGVPLHAASVSFAVNSAPGARPLEVGLLFLGGATGALAFAAPRRGSGRGFLSAILALFLVLHYAPLLGMKSQALAARSTDFVALAVVAAAGGAFATLESWAAPRLGYGPAAAGALLLAAGVWVTSPPATLHMEPQLSTEFALEVIRLTREETPGMWIAVGRSTLLAMVQGYGGQLDGDVFVQQVAVPPSGRTLHQSLAAMGQTDAARKPENDPALYLFTEPKPYMSEAEQRFGNPARIQKEAAEMARWVAEYSRVHGEPEVWYRSPALVIYRIAPRAGR